MVLIAAVTNDWKPATLQLFGEGSSYFVEHLLMAASERVKFFTQSTWGKNKVVISKGFIRSCSNFVKCEASVKRIRVSNFNNYMLKEPIEVSFYAIQANLPFTDANFTEAKYDKNSFN